MAHSSLLPEESYKASDYEDVHHKLRKIYSTHYRPALYRPFVGAVTVAADDVAILMASQESTIRRSGHLAIFTAGCIVERGDKIIAGVGVCCRQGDQWAKWLTRRAALQPRAEEFLPDIENDHDASLAAILFALHDTSKLPTTFGLSDALVAPAPVMTDQEIDRLDRKFRTGTRFNAIEQIQDIKPRDLPAAVHSITIYTDNKKALESIQRYHKLAKPFRGREERSVWIANIKKMALTLTGKAVRLSFHYVPKDAGVEGHEIATRLAKQASESENFAKWPGHPLGTKLQMIDALFWRKHPDTPREEGPRKRKRKEMTEDDRDVAEGEAPVSVKKGRKSSQT